MPLYIVHGDLSTRAEEVLVNSAHPRPIIGTGVEKALHDGAGPGLLAERRAYGSLKEGDLFKSAAHDLNARFIYHVVTPNYADKDAAPRLKALYERTLQQALNDSVHSIAFPLLGSGNQFFPKEDALSIATQAFKTFLSTHELDIVLVVYDLSTYRISTPLKDAATKALMPSPIPLSKALYLKAPEAFILSEKTFHAQLFAAIDAAELDDVTVYKRANISRKLFSKIRSHPDYKPSKKTVIALAIALEFSLDDTLDFLKSAGFTLSDSLMFDRIIASFIADGITDIFTINETLFFYDQTTL